jgi:hypothetical protein
MLGDMTADRSLIFVTYDGLDFVRRSTSHAMEVLETVLVIFEFTPFHRRRRLHSELSFGVRMSEIKRGGGVVDVRRWKWTV